MNIADAEKEFKGWWASLPSKPINCTFNDSPDLDEAAIEKRYARTLFLACWEKAWELSALTTLLEAAKPKARAESMCG